MLSIKLENGDQSSTPNREERDCVQGRLLSTQPPDSKYENQTPMKTESRDRSSPPIYPVQPFAHSTPVLSNRFSRHSISELLEKPITPIGQIRTSIFQNKRRSIQFPIEQNTFVYEDKKDEHLGELLSPTNDTQRNDSPTFSSSPTSANSSPDLCEGVAKKKSNRTNYTPSQVRALEEVFLETPYPDPDAMEQLAIDLNIQEQKIKVWFQNKRARSKKRVIDNKFSNFPPIHPFYMQHMMTSQLNSYPMSGGAPGFFPFPGTPSAQMIPSHMQMFPYPYMFTPPPQQQ